MSKSQNLKGIFEAFNPPRPIDRKPTNPIVSGLLDASEPPGRRKYAAVIANTVTSDLEATVDAAIVRPGTSNSMIGRHFCMRLGLGLREADDIVEKLYAGSEWIARDVNAGVVNAVADHITFDSDGVPIVEEQKRIEPGCFAVKRGTNPFHPICFYPKSDQNCLYTNVQIDGAIYKGRPDPRNEDEIVTPVYQFTCDLPVLLPAAQTSNDAAIGLVPCNSHSAIVSAPAMEPAPSAVPRADRNKLREEWKRIVLSEVRDDNGRPLKGKPLSAVEALLNVYFYNIGLPRRRQVSFRVRLKAAQDWLKRHPDGRASIQDTTLKAAERSLRRFHRTLGQRIAAPKSHLSDNQLARPGSTGSDQ